MSNWVSTGPLLLSIEKTNPRLPGASNGVTISTDHSMRIAASRRSQLFERSLAFLDKLSARNGRVPVLPHHLALGKRGEEAAFFYLQRRGYVITARSWRSYRYAGDIDLIGWDGDCLCFVEVKTRTTRDIASAEAAVDEHKRKTLRKIARHYMRQLPAPGGTRFDILSIYFEAGKRVDFTLFQNAFAWSEGDPY